MELQYIVIIAEYATGAILVGMGFWAIHRDKRKAAKRRELRN